MSFGDYMLSLKAREAFEAIAVGVVNKLRPAPRYGVITAIHNSNSGRVLFTGEPYDVPVNFGAIVPSRTGLRVRVGGKGGDHYVEDVFNDPGIIPVWTPVPLLDGWSPATAFWDIPRVTVSPGGEARILGRISGTSAAGQNILRVPPEFRPLPFGDVESGIADAGGPVRWAIYTSLADNISSNLDGILFSPGKSGAVSNLNLSSIRWSVR